MTSLSHVPNLFGLIGYPLSHSFSKGYFAEKFDREGIEGCYYESFPLEMIEELPELLDKYKNLKGLNVTIPYKEAVIPYLDGVDPEAQAIGAVNTIKRMPDDTLVGYNTDVYGFEQSLREKLAAASIEARSALVLGTGGAGKAVFFVLEKMGIKYQRVSRKTEKGDLTYGQINEQIIAGVQLIINTTPLGMSPHVHTFPQLPYTALNSRHLLYDLVYNPEKTIFLQKGEDRGAAFINGLEMLHLQAEKSWEIWTSPN
jgi:shikimate dehydrogenase